MNSDPIATAVALVVAFTAGIANAQPPAPAQTPGAGAQPAYSVASPPITSPLSAPAGKD